MYKRIISFFRPVILPVELKRRKTEVILHIGDVPEWEFSYIKRLIKKVQPEIIVHTGDLVDNLKVGRKPEDIPAYKKYAKELIRFMEDNSSEGYMVPGNNDIEDYIRKTVTKTQIVPADTCIRIKNIPCLLCHRVMDISGDGKFYLYGHGPTGDTHPWAENGKDGRYYSNVFFAPAVIFADGEKMIRLKGFKRRK